MIISKLIKYGTLLALFITVYNFLYPRNGEKMSMSEVSLDDIKRVYNEQKDWVTQNFGEVSLEEFQAKFFEMAKKLGVKIVIAPEE